MKVIHTIQGLSPSGGGPSRSVPGLCEAISKVGVQVKLISSDNLTKLNYYKTYNNTLFNKMLNYYFPLNYYRFFKESSEKFNPDIIHVHGIWLPSNHLTVKYANKINIPFIISPHGTLEPWSLLHKAFKKRIGWYLYQKNDLEKSVVLHATSLKEYESIRKIGLKNPVAILPNGVEIPEILIDTLIDRSKDKRIVLYLSRIHPIKGLLNLVKAWSHLRPKNWKIIIAGPDEGGHKKEVERTIVEEKLGDSIQFLGEISNDEKWPILKNADLFVLPSYSENFGIVVAEALAVGVPVITTKGTPWGVLEETGSGWWIEPGVESLTNALRGAIALTDQERKSMGLRGRALVEERFAWGNIAKGMKEVYSWVLGHGPKPDCIEMR